MKNVFDCCLADAQTAAVNGRYDTALEYSKKALSIRPKSTAALFMAGNACFLLERFEDGEHYFRKSLELDKKNGDTYFYLGNCLFGQKRIAEAVEAYARAERYDCSAEAKKKIYFLMGSVNQLDGNNKEALINYEKADKMPGINTDQADMLLKKIQIYVEQLEYEKAEECALELKLLLPGEFKTYQLLFQLYLEQRKTASAEAILKEAAVYCGESRENRVEMAFNRAFLYCFMAEQDSGRMVQHYGHALTCLHELQKREKLSLKDGWEAVITSAEIHLKLKNYDKAAKLARKAEEQTDPELREYTERGRYILLLCLEHNKCFGSVKPYAKKMKESSNVSYRHLGYYVEAYAAKKLAEGNPALKHQYIDLYNQAIAYYKNAAVVSPGDFMAYLYRAKSYVDLGRYDKAQEIGKLLPEEANKTLEIYIGQVRGGGN